MEYYCRKEGYSNLGLHHIPPSKVSEQNAKVAIQMSIVLQSLSKSQYASEPWTLQDTSADLFASPPKNCFKKRGYEVTVWFDDKKENAFPYINWSDIYYQDAEDKWHKTHGKVDYDGLYYEESDGSKSYFILFFEDASRYGDTNMWSVHYNNEHIYVPSTSSSRRAAGLTISSEKSDSIPHTSRDTTQSTGYGRSTTQTEEAIPRPPERLSALRRRRRGEGESTRAKRRRPAGRSAVPSPESVGRSHRSVARTNLTRLERLQAEAWDPFLILLRGPANTLKCWRYRCNLKCGSPIISSVFKWVTSKDDLQQSRMLLAFTSNADRELFLETVKFPQGTSWALGSLDSL